jgi:hypothetical protein
MPKYASEGQILNFQNTFDSACDEMEIQSRKFLQKSNLNHWHCHSSITYYPDSEPTSNAFTSYINAECFTEK